jgi:TonB family protein
MMSDVRAKARRLAIIVGSTLVIGVTCLAAPGRALASKRMMPMSRQKSGSRVRLRWLALALTGFAGIALSADAPTSALGAAAAQWTQGNHKAALKTFQSLAEAGDVRAQLLLGRALIEGTDIARDMARGFAWLKIATSADVYGYGTGAAAAARTQIAALEPHMSGADLIEADRIAGEYLAAHATEYGVRMKAAAMVLTGRSADTTIGALPGCALDRSIANCEQARKIPDWSHSCTGNIMVPDLPATTDGPDAQLVPPEMPSTPPAWEGVVILLVHVDTTGYVCQLALLHGSGRKDVDQAVLNATRAWRYQPGLKGGTAVESLAEARVENLVAVPAAATKPVP